MRYALLLALWFSFSCSGSRSATLAKADQAARETTSHRCESQAVVVRDGQAIAISGQQESVFAHPEQLIGWLTERQRRCAPAPLTFVFEPSSEQAAHRFAEALRSAGVALGDLLPVVAETDVAPRVYRSREELGAWTSVVPAEFPFHARMLVEGHLPKGPAIVGCLDEFMGPGGDTRRRERDAYVASLPEASPTPDCCRGARASRRSWWLAVELPESPADQINGGMTGHKKGRCRARHPGSQLTLFSVPRSALPVVFGTTGRRGVD